MQSQFIQYADFKPYLEYLKSKLIVPDLGNNFIVTIDFKSVIPNAKYRITRNDDTIDLKLSRAWVKVEGYGGNISDLSRRNTAIFPEDKFFEKCQKDIDHVVEILKGRISRVDKAKELFESRKALIDQFCEENGMEKFYFALHKQNKVELYGKGLRYDCAIEFKENGLDIKVKNIVLENPVDIFELPSFNLEKAAK